MLRAARLVSIFVLLLGLVGGGARGQGEPSRSDLKLYPQLKDLLRKGATSHDGVISSVLATETSCSFGVSGKGRGTSGFTVSKVTDARQALLVKTILLAFEKQWSVTVYSSKRGEVYAVVVRGPAGR